MVFIVIGLGDLSFLPDYYDFWGQGKRRKWLLKNLVEKNNYKMTEEMYNSLISASNSPVNLIE